MTTLTHRHEPLSPEATQEAVAFFQREGYVLVKGVLSRDEVDELRQAIDRIFADPTLATEDRAYGDIVMVRLFECSPLFRDLLVREPIVSLAEAILGGDCHIIANNVVRNPPGRAISSWHVDDFLWFPLPEELPRFDARMVFPTFLMNGQLPLTDIPTVAHGPTEVVPGSQYSGRRPPPDDPAPSFEGRGPQAILCEAGDFYWQHPQVWHRGAPNTSTTTRYLLQQAYGRRFVAQRFFPFLNYRMPDHVLHGADERLLRVLGKHPKGAYG